MSIRLLLKMKGVYIVRIFSGIKNGALLQRDSSGFCRCTFTAEVDGELKTTLGHIEKCGNNEYVLSAIPVGGPYELELYDDSKREYFELWVGDLWILAGQSNMEGAGCVTVEVENQAKEAGEFIRSYYLDSRWDKAVPVLHEPWLSPDDCLGGVWRKVRRESVWQNEDPFSYCGNPVGLRAVGPGYYFAKRMFEITNVPQAVIPCALGGSFLDGWKKDSENENNLYGLMLRRFKETGSFIRGIFWDQGESETYEGNDFTGKMIKFISDVRNDMNNPHLPFVQVQIAKTSIPSICSNPQSGIEWSRIKEEQRTLEEKIHVLKTVSAADADFEDMIHYSSQFQQKMGIRAANAMAKLIGEGGFEPPYPAKITYRKDLEYSPFNYIFDIYYENVKELTADGTPSGFSVVPAGWDLKNIFNPSVGIQKIKINKNVVSLYTEVRDNPEDVWIFYGFGHMAHCNISTDTGFSLPAMGPVTVKG